MASYLTVLCIASSFSHTEALGSSRTYSSPSHPNPQFNSQQSFTRQRRRLFDRKMGAQKENTEGMDEFRERVRSAGLRSGFRNVRVTGSSRQRLTPDRDLSPQFTGQSDPGPIPPLRIMAASPSLPRAFEPDTSQLGRHQGFHLQIRSLSAS